MQGWNLAQLQAFATQVGVGYSGLGPAALLEKLVHEGMLQ